MHQIVCRLELRSRSHWGSLQRSPNPPAVFRGLLLRKWGKEKEQGKGKGRMRWKQKEEKGDGKEGKGVLPSHF